MLFSCLTTKREMREVNRELSIHKEKRHRRHTHTAEEKNCEEMKKKKPVRGFSFSFILFF